MPKCLPAGTIVSYGLIFYKLASTMCRSRYSMWQINCGGITCLKNY